MIDLLEYLVAMWIGAAVGFVCAAMFVAAGRD
jgi:type II secretory pathway component PulJ